MDKEELEKEITGILYDHTDIPSYVIVEADYEEVVKDIVKLFSMHPVVGGSETTEQLKCCNVDCQEPTEGKSVYCSFHKSM